jgi:hypothetical protein
MQGAARRTPAAAAFLVALASSRLLLCAGVEAFALPVQRLGGCASPRLHAPPPLGGLLRPGGALHRAPRNIWVPVPSCARRCGARALAARSRSAGGGDGSGLKSAAIFAARELKTPVTLLSGFLGAGETIVLCACALLSGFVSAGKATVLCGSLQVTMSKPAGAGKTTVLKHILENKEGIRVGSQGHHLPS